MSTTSVGRQAEDMVAKYLKAKKYKVLDQNWRHVRAEIDLVASKKKVAYFIEVKYRGSDSQGTGLEYITPKKLKQMQFAAELWVTEHNWQHDYALLAAEVNKAGDIYLVEC